MTVSSAVLERAVISRVFNKGAEIRAKIAANRATRLSIAEAMKREAGVAEHTVHKADFGGLAYIGTGRIYSPECRKIVRRSAPTCVRCSCGALHPEPMVSASDVARDQRKMACRTPAVGARPSGSHAEIAQPMATPAHNLPRVGCLDGNELH